MGLTDKVKSAMGGSNSSSSNKDTSPPTKLGDTTQPENDWGRTEHFEPGNNPGQVGGAGYGGKQDMESGHMGKADHKGVGGMGGETVTKEFEGK